MLHVLGERLLGKNYSNSHILSSVRDLPALGLEQSLRALRESGLEFDPRSGEGILVLTSDERMKDSTECLLFGRSRACHT